MKEKQIAPVAEAKTIAIGEMHANQNEVRIRDVKVAKHCRLGSPVPQLEILDENDRSGVVDDILEALFAGW